MNARTPPIMARVKIKAIYSSILLNLMLFDVYTTIEFPFVPSGESFRVIFAGEHS
jgi:hypothetical protein